MQVDLICGWALVGGTRDRRRNPHLLVELPPAAQPGFAVFDVEDGFDPTLRLAVPAGGNNLERSGNMLDGYGDGVVVHAVHVELSRGPVGRARVVGEVGFRDIDPGFGQLEGLLAPVDGHDRLEVCGDEGQKSGPHDAYNHHDDDRQPQHHPPLFAQQGQDHRGPPRFLRYTSVASLCLAGSSPRRSTSTVNSMRRSLISASSVTATAGGQSSALLHGVNRNPSVATESRSVWTLPPLERLRSCPLR